MNTLKIALVSAMLVGPMSLSNGICSDTCMSPCNVARDSCKALFNNNAQCDINHNICSTTCSKACACDDQCEEQCRGPLDTCLADHTGNLIAQANCNVQFDACLGACGAQCAVKTQIDFFQSGGSAPSSESKSQKDAE